MKDHMMMHDKYIALGRPQDALQEIDQAILKCDCPYALLGLKATREQTLKACPVPFLPWFKPNKKQSEDTLREDGERLASGSGTL